MYDVCVIGHITRDMIRIKDVEKEMPGGVAYYFPMTLKRLDSDVCVVTKLAEKDKSLLSDLVNNNIEVFYSKSEETTTFENIYLRDLNSRIQNVRHVAHSFTPEDIVNISARIFHLGPLTGGDIPLEILRRISKRSKISLDVQGYLRTVQRGEIKSINWEERDEGLTYVNILKADEAEAAILSEEKDIEKAAVKLSGYGIDEVVITRGNKGSLIYSKGKFYSISAFHRTRIVDTTGCGDAYMAGYIYKRLKSCNIDEAQRFAAALASLKLEEFGPFKGSKKDVQSLL